MLLLLLAACSDPPAPPPPEVPFADRTIDAAGMAKAFPSDRVKDRAGWAADLHAVLVKHEIATTNGNTCAAVATVEQESGYQTDPAVPGIGGMIDTWIEEKTATMNKVEGWAFASGLRAALNAKPDHQPTSFYDRLHAAKTERDVDTTYRELVAYYRGSLPKPLRAAESAARLVGFDLDDLNPISTVGCLQVRVDWAEDHAKDDGLEPAGVRDDLYTRAGCLHYGVERLLGWDAGYDSPTYRFADYNSGLYASRNAAFQEAVEVVAGTTLALDGDLLRYNDHGKPAAEASQTLQALMKWGADPTVDLPEARLRRDLEKEKERTFEETKTWEAVRAAYQKKVGKEAPYARMPNVHLASMKLSGDKTTTWYATNVKKRYDSCLARLKAGS